MPSIFRHGLDSRRFLNFRTSDLESIRMPDFLEIPTEGYLTLEILVQCLTPVILGIPDCPKYVSSSFYQPSIRVHQVCEMASLRKWTFLVAGNPPTPSAVERARSAGPSLRPSGLTETNCRPDGYSLEA